MPSTPTAVDSSAHLTETQSSPPPHCNSASLATPPTPASRTHHKQRQKADKSTRYVVMSLLAGGVAGCVAKTAVAPLDRVKILFQGLNTSFNSERGNRGGTFKTLRKIFDAEGVRGLFKGHSAMLARIFPYAAINYMMFEQLKLLFLTPETKHPEINRLLAGSLAGAASVFCTYPLDLIRARMAFQVKETRYLSISHTMRTMLQEGGVHSLYRGFSPTLLGILPYAGISFYTFDTLKYGLVRAVPQHVLKDNGDVRVAVHLSCGAVAGAAAQTAAYPLDVIRRRMQLTGMARSLGQLEYDTTWHAFRTIWQSEGVRGLFIGLSINYVKVVPAVSLSFATYEFLKKKFNIS